MSAPAEQEPKIETPEGLRTLAGILAHAAMRGELPPTDTGQARLRNLAAALDALAAAHRGCNAVICTYPSGYEQRCTTEYLCGACDERRESAISTLTGAPRP